MAVTLVFIKGETGFEQSAYGRASNECLLETRYNAYVIICLSKKFTGKGVL